MGSSSATASCSAIRRLNGVAFNIPKRRNKMRHLDQARDFKTEWIVPHPIFAPPTASMSVQALGKTDVEEVLSFLHVRPVHTVVMASFIRDNGIVSDLN